VVPELGVVEEMKGSVSDALVLRCASDAEVAVKLGQRVVHTIELWEFKLVGGRDEVTAWISVIVSRDAAAAIGATLILLAHHVLDAYYGKVEGLVLLLLLGHHGFNGNELIFQWLQGSNNFFDGSESTRSQG
jgi:hypothetical protein